MKKVNRKHPFHEQVLNAHNIRRPVKNAAAMLNSFSGRTNRTLQIGELLDMAKIAIALKRQIALQNKHIHPSG